MAKKHDFVLSKGETFTLNFNLTDASGEPVDLTGHTITLSLREPDGETPIDDYVVDGGLNMVIKVDDEVTSEWPVGNNRYVLINDEPNGDRRYMAYGSLTVKEVF